MVMSVEATAGFKPANIGLAGRPLRSLEHVATGFEARSRGSLDQNGGGEGSRTLISRMPIPVAFPTMLRPRRTETRDCRHGSLLYYRLEVFGIDVTKNRPSDEGGRYGRMGLSARRVEYHRYIIPIASHHFQSRSLILEDTRQFFLSS